MQNYFGAFYFGEFKPHNSNTRVMPTEVATVSIFTPFNFALSLSSWNSRNKGHANIKGFTIYPAAKKLIALTKKLNRPIVLVFLFEIEMSKNAAFHSCYRCFRQLTTAAARLLPSNDDVMSSSADARAYKRSNHAGCWRSRLPRATQHQRPVQRHDGRSNDGVARRPHRLHEAIGWHCTTDGTWERRLANVCLASAPTSRSA